MNKQIKENKYQEALNNLKSYYDVDSEYLTKHYPYKHSKEYAKNINTIQELINYHNELIKKCNSWGFISIEDLIKDYESLANAISELKEKTKRSNG